MCPGGNGRELEPEWSCALIIYYMNVYLDVFSSLSKYNAIFQVPVIVSRLEERYIWVSER